MHLEGTDYIDSSIDILSLKSCKMFTRAHLHLINISKYIVREFNIHLLHIEIKRGKNSIGGFPKKEGSFL